MKTLVLAGLLCSGSLFAATPVYVGEAGLHPVQVAMAYLKDKVSNPAGQFEYQRLDIKQRSAGEDFSHTRISVEIKGLMDDSVASERYRLSMSLVDEAWVIHSEQQDHTCRRGPAGYTQKLCR